MGYMMLLAHCFVCKRQFTCNPDLVPSFQGEPICDTCIVIVNEERVKRGNAPAVVHPDAYEPQEVA